jgi:DNA-binding NarL/FixJ family response regulator
MPHLTELRTVLSPREQEVAASLAAGLSNRQIASQLTF